jgi:polar amino acid transport system substrate-binding protein
MMARRLIVGLSAALVLTAAAPTLQARPLDSIKARGQLMVCANPNALPYAAKNGDRPGIQLELAKALADQLGVGLEVGWVVLGVQVSRVDCDIVLDSIADKAVQGERRIKLSRPYQQSGVALAFRPGLEPVATYAELKPGLRIGTLVSSLARVYLGQHDIDSIPYAFEDEMVEALGKGEIDVAALSPATIGFYNLTHPDAAVSATMAFESVPELNWAVAVGMRKADDALIETVNAALGKLIEDGTVSAIYARYGVEHRLPPNPD